jgi:hypothetical protein
VGFDPVESRQPDEKDRERWTSELQQVLSKTRLLEYSAVGIGSNEDTNTLARRGVSDRLIRWWSETGKPEGYWCKDGKCLSSDALRSLFPVSDKVISIPSVSAEGTSPVNAASVEAGKPEVTVTTAEPGSAKSGCKCSESRGTGGNTSAQDNPYSLIAGYEAGKMTYEQATAALDAMTSLPSDDKAKFKAVLDAIFEGKPALPANEASDDKANPENDGPEHGPGRSGEPWIDRCIRLAARWNEKLAEFTEGEQECISAKIGKFKDEGMDQDQAIAAAISYCAPEKSTSKAATLIMSERPSIVVRDEPVADPVFILPPEPRPSKIKIDDLIDQEVNKSLRRLREKRRPRIRLG